MNSDFIKEICNGNINKLKQIAKSKINHLLLSELLTNMENNKYEIQESLDRNLYSCDNKYNVIYNSNRIQNIIECISYLKKIT
jgi:hypothetical protein